MIVKSLPASHSHNLGQYLATGSEENEESFITNQRGLITNLPVDAKPWLMHTAINELDMMAAANNNVKQHILHAIINPDIETSTEMNRTDWRHAWTEYEAEYGLESQPFIEATQKKNNRVHVHRLYLRVNTETSEPIKLTFSHKRNEKVARILEFDLDSELVHGPHNRWVIKKLKRQRPDVAKWLLAQRAHEIDRPQSRKTESEHKREVKRQMSIEKVEYDLQTAWASSDSGTAFQEAIGEKGYKLFIGRYNRPIVLDPEGTIHGLRRRLWLKGTEGTKALDQKLSDLKIEKLEDGKPAINNDTNNNEPQKPKEQPDPEGLKAEKQRLQRWNAKLKSIDAEIEDRETSLSRREELVLERDLHLQELQKEIEDDQFKLADNITAWEERLSEREQLLIMAEKSVYKRSEDLSKKEQNYKYNKEELAKEKEQISDLKAQLRDQLDGSANSEKPPLNGQSTQHPVAELNALRGTKSNGKQNEGKKQKFEQDSPTKQSSIERKTLASLKLRQNWERQELKNRASQFSKEDPKKNENDKSPMRHFKKSAGKPHHRQTRTEDPVKPELNLEPPPIKPKKYHDILLLKGSSQKHVLASLEEKGAGLDVSQFSKKSAKIINGYHDRVAAAAQEQVSNKIEEYRSRYYQQIEPLNSSYKSKLASLLTKQKDTYQDHLQSEQGILQRMGFGLRQAGVMRLLKYMTNRDYRQDYLERKFERERAALKRPFQKQVNKIEKQLKKSLRVELQAIRRQQDKENRQLPKIRNQVRQEEFKMSLDREHSQITKGKMPEQKPTVDMPDIPELTTPQPLVSEKSLNEISTLAKDAQAQFNPDKPANDHNTRADSIIAKIDSVRNNSASKHKNIPEIRPSLN